MSSFELNKIIGAVLLAVLVMVVISKFGDNLVTTGGGHGAEEVTVTAKAKKPKKAEPVQPILGMLVSADAAAGKKAFGKCKACHSIENGGKNGIGPNLWNVVNANRGAKDGFKYSSALVAKEGKWTYESLNAFIAKPKAYIPGTKMSFAGVKKTPDRTNIVAYLRSLAGVPAPLPTQTEIDEVMKTLQAAKDAMAKAATDAAQAPAASANEVKKASAKPAAPKQDIGALLASADADKGKKVFGKCRACHTVDKGGRNGIGPNLWNIVNRAPGSVDAFKYSKALAELKEKSWNYANLDAFLAKPKTYAKGTKMTFVGLRKESDRANLIAYLRGLSDLPAPLN
ncbi:MAG: cytochrome c family protein [Pseudomonadota bacterium]|nr:cytochrome c family protein [Pseudomonadota bacterium]